MNVAELLNDRAEELAAFSALLFRKRPRLDNDSDNRVTQRTRTVVRYRRPSSANVPLSNVVRMAKCRQRRAKRFAKFSTSDEFVHESPSSSKEKQMQKKKRPLNYAEWCLLLRRRRRFFQRQRPTACRRRIRRLIALRQGKKQPPLCDCAAPSPPALSNSWPYHLSVTGTRTAVLWLPSHRQLCRRFHYRITTLRIEGCCLSNDTTPRFFTVRVAVPTKSQRKQHRVFQRWVARLPVLDAMRKFSRRPRCKPMALPPPLCFAVERSHECVWIIQPRESGHEMSAEEVMNLLLMRGSNSVNTTLYTRNLAKTREETEGSSMQSKQFWHCWERGVFYGYMWSFRENVDEMQLPRAQAKSSDPSTTPLVVPVVLFRNSLEERSTYCLMAAAPVNIGARARQKLNIRLVSHWNPCGATKVMCSVFELWCCADAVSMQGVDATPWSDTLLIVDWIQRRVDAAVTKWRAVSSGSSLFTEDEKEHQALCVSSLLEKTTVYIFPSLSPSLETIDHATFSIRRCVMTILLLSTESHSRLDKCSSSLPCPVSQNRTQHFRLARHLFASLTDTTAAIWGTRGGNVDKVLSAFCRCRTSLGYTRSVRVIGEEERDTLLRLVGCPTFTDMSGVSASFQTSRMARLCCSLSNAHQRVLLKFAAKGGRMHQHEGSALCILRPGTPAVLLHIGAITSPPFFSMRFGCRVAYAWVWDNNGWELIQAYLRCGCHTFTRHRGTDSCKELTMDVGLNCNDSGVCFFISAPERFLSLLPYLSGSPPRIPCCPTSVPQAKRQRCGLRRRDVSAHFDIVAQRRWQAMEAALCDENVCFPVEVVRLGATVIATALAHSKDEYVM